MIAMVCGFGFCCAASSKNPLEKLTGGSAPPTGCIEKYFGYWNSLLTSRPNSEKKVFPFWIMIGIAGAIRLVP